MSESQELGSDTAELLSALVERQRLGNLITLAATHKNDHLKERIIRNG